MAANLAKLEVPALLKLRDEVEARLASMKDTLTEHLAALALARQPNEVESPTAASPLTPWKCCGGGSSLAGGRSR
jgi:hypothetical protein